MIISKVQKKPSQNKATVSKMSPAMETSMLGIRSTVDAIRERAFQLYEKRGAQSGDDLQDWLRAEHQILAR